MVSVSNDDRPKHNELPLVFDGPAGRRLPLHILFVHSNAVNVGRCVQELRRAQFKVSSDVALNAEQFTKHLNSKYYDLVLAEYPFPKWKGRAPLETLNLLDKQIPCIVLIKTMQLETVARLITEGAADCVAIDLIGHLPIAIRRALREGTLREERDQTEKRLRHSEARYRALVGNLTYGMCRCTLDGKLLEVNQALVTMLGYSSAAELLEVNLIDGTLCDAFRRAQSKGHTLGENGPDPLEIEWQRKNGTAVRVRLSGREVANKSETDSYEVIVEDVTEQRKLETHLRQQAAKDPLTGLANYRHLVETVDGEIERSERTAREFALLFLDLDGLKRINDRFGHLVGSQALCRLADVLSMCSRNLDTPARFGGDEFALVLPETGLLPAKIVARRICSNLANDGTEPKLSVSIGVAIYPKDGKNIESLLSAADAALYAMKGRPRSARTSAQSKTVEFRRKTAAAGKRS